MALAIGAGLVVLAFAGPSLIRRMAGQSFAFTPLDRPKGFRFLDGGPVTGGVDPLIGVGAGFEAGSTRPSATRVSALAAAPCPPLFGAVPPGAVPLAVFTDVNCPRCRRFSSELAGRSPGRQPQLSVRYHELPRLGPTSELAARAALAAGLQDAYLPFHRRLMATPIRPSRRFLADLATDLELDPDRLITDMEGGAVAAQLAESAALAELFGFFATPAMVAGRTAVLGALGPERFEALLTLEAEAEAAEPVPCA